jgi:hypothetical protein
MDFNERSITGPDNQGPWPLLEPAGVYFRAGIFGILYGMRPESAECGRPLTFWAENTKAPIANRGLDLIPDAVFQIISG